MDEFRLRIGNAVLSLLFEDEENSRAFGHYLGRTSSPLPPDLSLTIRYRDDAPDSDEVPNSLFLTKEGDGNGFSMAGGLITGRYSPDSAEGELTVQRLITRGGFARVFEQVFFQTYWSVAKKKGLDSFLLHSGGAVRRGRGWVFCGQSGTGKSTSVTLSLPLARVLNDEITLIDLSSPPTLRDTPFNGFFPQKQEGEAPLGGILLLRQAPLHRLTRTREAEAVKTLAREIIPPMGLETAASSTVFMDMVRLADRAKAVVPLYTMEFLPDPGFWDKIDELPQEG